MAWVELELSRKSFVKIHVEVPDDFPTEKLMHATNNKVIKQAIDDSPYCQRWQDDTSLTPEVEYVAACEADEVTELSCIDVDLSKIQ